jgi:purine-binding chemotaxis protein CheW
LDDEVLGRNPLEVELDSIWKVPKKTPVIQEPIAKGDDSSTAAQSAYGGEQAWAPLDNEDVAGAIVDEDIAAGFDILSGVATEVENETGDEYNVESIQLVGFKLGYELYGIDIMNIQEIIRNLEITRVPRALDFVKGVVNLRGKVIPVISLRDKFNFAEQEVSQEKVRIIIVSAESGLLGFEVDEVTEVQRIPKNIIVPPPPSTTRLDDEYIIGVGRLDEQLIVILDIEQLISTTSLTIDTL